MLEKFFKFSLVGVTATAIHYLVLVALVEFLAVNATLASSLGFAISSAVNYRLNYRFTFNSSKRHSEAYIRFLCIASAGLLLNAITIAILTGPLGWYYLLAQVTATVCVLFWNFTGNLLWTFKEV